MKCAVFNLGGALPPRPLLCIFAALSDLCFFSCESCGVVSRRPDHRSGIGFWLADWPLVLSATQSRYDKTFGVR